MSVPPPPGDSDGKTYIPASYVKWVESGGARVIPIEYDTPQEEASIIFDGKNGLLFIGGDGQPSECSRYLFQRAIDANNGGDYFPVVCLPSLLPFRLSEKNVYEFTNLAFPHTSHSVMMSFSLASFLLMRRGRVTINFALLMMHVLC